MTPETARFREFAKLLGVSPGYVTALKGAGRLVLTADGRAVRVAESLARIEATRDPEKQGVRDYHAENRARSTEAPRAPVDIADDADDDIAAASGDGDQDTIRARRAKRISLELRAAQDKLDLQERLGKLVDSEQVRRAGADLGIGVRVGLERLPGLLAALVDEHDRGRIHAAVTEHIEQVLSDLARSFARATDRSAA